MTRHEWRQDMNQKSHNMQRLAAQEGKPQQDIYYTFSFLFFVWYVKQIKHNPYLIITDVKLKCWMQLHVWLLTYLFYYNINEIFWYNALFNNNSFVVDLLTDRCSLSSNITIYQLSFVDITCQVMGKARLSGHKWGPRSDPCGTPVVRLWGKEVESLNQAIA